MPGDNGLLGDDMVATAATGGIDGGEATPPIGVAPDGDITLGGDRTCCWGDNTLGGAVASAFVRGIVADSPPGEGGLDIVDAAFLLEDDAFCRASICSAANA